MRAFLGERHLARYSCQGLLAREFIAKGEALDLLFLVCVDHDDPIHVPVISCLNEKGGVKNDDGIRLPALKMVYLRGKSIKDPGVKAAVQPRPFLRIVEYEFAQLSAVDAAVRQQDIFAEVVEHLATGLLFGFEQLMYDPVGIYEMDAEVFEYPRNKAFPASYAACQSYDEHPNAFRQQCCRSS